MNTFITAVRRLWRNTLAFYRAPVTGRSHTPPTQSAGKPGASIFGPDKQCAHPVLQPRRRRTRTRGAA